ncbi:hypothetical protein EPUL_005059, partial [Erysiphe pulchra]
MPSPRSVYVDTDPALVELIPSDLWSLPYLSFPGILAAATRVNPVRVGEICAAFQATTPSVSSISATPNPSLKISAPTITPYD